jgi:hypothetical protein
VKERRDSRDSKGYYGGDCSLPIQQVHN